MIYNDISSILVKRRDIDKRIEKKYILTKKSPRVFVVFNLLLRYQLLHRSFSKRKKSRQSFSPTSFGTPFGTLFNQPRRKWACAYSDDPGAHNSGRRSSDEEEKTIQPFEIGQGRGRVSSFSNCDGVRGEGGGLEEGVLCECAVCCFQGCTAKGCRWLNGTVIVFSIRSPPFPGGGCTR